MRTIRIGCALALAAGVAGCNLGDDFAEDLVDKAAKRNEDRRIEQQREELPLPDPEAVPYKSLSVADIELDEGFRVNLVDDLVIGEGRNEPEYLFVNFSGSSSALGNVAVDGDGRFFVLETRDSEVRVFDTDGEFVRKFGQPGEGPADFYGPYGMIIAGDQVHVFHRSYYSSIWDVDGNFVRDRRKLLTPEAEDAAALLERTKGTMSTSPSESQRRRQARVFRTPLKVIGRPDGSMLMVFRATPEEEHQGRIQTPYVRVLSRFAEGKETERVFEVPDWAGASFAVTESGEMYVGMFGHLRTEHYTVALAADGTPRWVLVTPWDPEVPPRMELRVDGEGRLYLFPNFNPEVEVTESAIDGTQNPVYKQESPVYVLTSDGDPIGAGYLNRLPLWLHWQISQGEHVYGVRIDPSIETAEWEVVRYRIEVGS